MMRLILIGIAVLMTVGFGFAGWQWYRGGEAGTAYGGPFQLVDQAGAEITEQAFRGHPSAVFFGFTHCPEICPTTLFELDGWLKQLGPEGEAIRGYFVTVDPARDTPEVMKAYVSNVSDRITGVSGDREKVEAMLKAFGIYFKRIDLQGGDYTMDHTASIMLLDRSGDFAGTIAYGENPENAVAKLKRLAAG